MIETREQYEEMRQWVSRKLPGAHEDSLFETIEALRNVARGVLIDMGWGSDNEPAEQCRICGWISTAGPQHSPECPMEPLAAWLTEDSP